MKERVFPSSLFGLGLASVEGISIAQSQKALDENPPEIRKRMGEKISELFETPYPTGYRKLKGAARAYRLKVGDYRILYAIVSKEEILIFKIAQSETAY